MLTPQMQVLVLWFVESWVLVEQRGYKGHVEPCVSAHDIAGGYKLSAAEVVSLFEHRLSSLGKILLLVKQIQIFVGMEQDHFFSLLSTHPTHFL